MTTNQRFEFVYLVYLTVLIQVMVNLYPITTYPPLSWLDIRSDDSQSSTEGFLFFMAFFLAAAIFGLLRPYLPTNTKSWIKFIVGPLAVTALEFIFHPFSILNYLFVSGTLLFIGLIISIFILVIQKRRILIKHVSGNLNEQQLRNIRPLTYTAVLMLFLSFMIISIMIGNLLPWTINSVIRLGIYITAIVVNVRLFLPSLISRIENPIIQEVPKNI